MFGLFGGAAPSAAARISPKVTAKMQAGTNRRPRGLFGSVRDWANRSGEGGISNADRLATIGAMLRDDPAIGQNALQMQQQQSSLAQQRFDELQAQEGQRNTAQKDMLQEQQAQQERRRIATERGYSPEAADLYALDPDQFMGVVAQNFEAANVGAGDTRIGGFRDDYTAPVMGVDNGQGYTQTPGGFQVTGETIGANESRANTANTLNQIQDRNADNRRADAEARNAGFDAERQVRNDAEGALGSFREVEDSYTRVLASARDPSPAGDLALIFNYMKVLDPGSTVREGEFATAQNSAGLPGRLRAQYNNIVNGERLEASQRQDFVERANMLYADQRRLAEERLSIYRGIADARNLDPSRSIPRLSEIGQEAGDDGLTEAEQRELDELERRFGGQ